MGYASNREPRRRWSTDRARVPCASCGASARLQSTELPFCDACLDWARRTDLADRDELGASD